MPTPRPISPWRTYLTLDTLVSLAWLPLPVAWSLPLLSLATSPSWTSPSLPYTFLIAVFFTSLHLFSFLNDWIAHRSARKLDWSEEVVVITGGASGLGRSIAEILGMRGATVAILDVREPADGGVEAIGEGVRWYLCDVGNLEAVRKVKHEIEKDVCRFPPLDMHFHIHCSLCRLPQFSGIKQ